MTTIRKVRYYIYLKDVLILSLTAFGGPQVFLAMVIDIMVKKRRYITEKDLLELNALCLVLPGPTSTQTVSAIGFRVGGPNLAYLSLLVWILPGTLLMISTAFLIEYLQSHTKGELSFAKFIQPMAIGYIIYASQITIKKMIHSVEAAILMMISAFIAFFYNSPFIFPIMLVIGGLITTHNYNKQPVIEEKSEIKISWDNFIVWATVLIVAAVLGHYTRILPIRLFENFYRNGSLIFGGGQVLVPYLYTEFVEFKNYLSSEEFLTGYAISQSIPGPTFSISSYIGALSMREWGAAGMITGGLVAAAGIFLPGTFLIFFVIRFWDGLKKYRPVRAALEGINAVSCGMLIAAAYLLFEPMENNFINIIIIIGTYILLRYSKIPSPLIIVLGVGIGLIYQWILNSI
ncbi:chromate efflux transporter [Cyclobacterium marinum]|uniref:Chromate transporter, chromate ion transporter (CHR) family n=1 Tax=Cyclobacterium marinum (strain ATCC 25205 / DSM 745 / LMG 13164 / NCIMB 1802) TaxID=880070 RepID=G0J1W6_CYCMS|nr:chromate efflux transporter [Cyclobacterium marinum]AEL23972.1 chromate transporter, chromate ion transporter (CHR) family [Cyclobacterium marinum DSM 745]MBI0398756.1 chromate efflux transporter [Cyclobacterium marinum]MBR9776719.1 chromate efflux transporter [Cytophagales bacterium]|tara:strand:- start:38467 stop:39675 length:1209 start_codon:yes stop_codon:yes gene_type:complete